MFEAGVLLGIVGLIVCVLDWRKGVAVCLLVGFVQDPLRKLDPSQAVYFTALVIPFVVATLFGLMVSKRRVTAAQILSIYPSLKPPLMFFAFVIVAQALNAYARTSSVVVLFIGLMAYLAPMLTLYLGINYVVGVGRELLLLRLYVVLGAIFVAGVLLEAAGVKWAIIGSVGTQLYFYTEKVNVLYAGIMRAAEISAWHGAMVAMLSAVLYTIAKRGVARNIWVLVLAITLLSVFLTGRRKGLAEFAMFSLLAIVISFLSGARFSKAYIGVILGVVGLALFALQYMPVSAVFSDFSEFVLRLGYFPESPLQRAWNMTVGSFEYVLRDNSVFGSGIGVGSQGAQHYGGMLTGASAESGFGKVLAEVGVIGVLAIGWLGWRMLAVVKDIVLVAKADTYYWRLSIGLVAILGANAANFALAHQAYGDPFVLLILGFVIGHLLAIPVLVNRKSAERGELLRQEEIHSTVSGGYAVGQVRRY